MMTKKVLVVDDDIGILEVVKIILEDSGYNVRTLDESVNIFNEIESFKPDLIFLDLWMPGLSGEEICCRLKGSKATAKIPVIILSAAMETKKVTQKCGATDFLAKPFEMDQLVSVVEKYTTS